MTGYIQFVILITVAKSHYHNVLERMYSELRFYKDLAIQFYGANRHGAKVSQGILDQFWLCSMQAGLKNAYECIKEFSETDFTEDLRKIDVPTLVMHGEV
jgi:hypothetical protein